MSRFWQPCTSKGVNCISERGNGRSFSPHYSVAASLTLASLALMTRSRRLMSNSRSRSESGAMMSSWAARIAGRRRRRISTPAGVASSRRERSLPDHSTNPRCSRRLTICMAVARSIPIRSPKRVRSIPGASWIDAIAAYSMGSRSSGPVIPVSAAWQSAWNRRARCDSARLWIGGRARDSG